MEAWIRHIRSRDLRFLFLVVLNLLLIGAYVGSIQQLGPSGGHGWRRIDIEAVRNRIESGDLSQHEALWYHRGTLKGLAGAGAETGNNEGSGP